LDKSCFRRRQEYKSATVTFTADDEYGVRVFVRSVSDEPIVETDITDTTTYEVVT
jgi:hypothetical protein